MRVIPDDALDLISGGHDDNTTVVVTRDGPPDVTAPIVASDLLKSFDPMDLRGAV